MLDPSWGFTCCHSSLRYLAMQWCDVFATRPGVLWLPYIKCTRIKRISRISLFRNSWDLMSFALQKNMETCINLPAKIRQAFSTVNERISDDIWNRNDLGFDPKLPGIPHHAAALPVPEPSLHLAIALHRRPMALSSILGAMLTLQRLVAWLHWCNTELDVDVGHKECFTKKLHHLDTVPM